MVDGYIENIPEYLYLHCETCVRFVQVEDLQQVVAEDGIHDGKKIIVGSCTRCGEECSDSVDTQQELERVARRSVAYYLKNKKRRDKRIAKKREIESRMATKTKRRRSSSKASKASTKTSKAKKGSKSTGTRQRHYSREEGQPTQKVAFALMLSGGMWTVEEAQDRYNSLAKKGVVGSRDLDIKTGDLSYMCGVGEIDVDGKSVEIYRSRDDDDNDVFGCPQLADALKKGARPGKLNKRGSKVTFKGMQLVKKRKELTS